MQAIADHAFNIGGYVETIIKKYNVFRRSNRRNQANEEDLSKCDRICFI